MQPRQPCGPVTNLIARTAFSALACAALVSCAKPVTRDQIIATAWSYTQLEWLPEERHVRHGPDRDGIPVRTPDRSLARHGDDRGWWQPGTPAKGMPYKWGGFDTPDQFLAGIAAGDKAGDIATPAKRLADDAGTSRESRGIDCSGFVSRCWGLDRPYSTRELPEISEPLASWDQLAAGDILLNNGHVVLFLAWRDPARTSLIVYEAGPFPVWKVSANVLKTADIRREGYAPWRYRHLSDPRQRSRQGTRRAGRRDRAGLQRAAN